MEEGYKGIIFFLKFKLKFINKKDNKDVFIFQVCVFGIFYLIYFYGIQENIEKNFLIKTKYKIKIFQIKYIKVIKINFYEIDF